MKIYINIKENVISFANNVDLSRSSRSLVFFFSICCQKWQYILLEGIYTRVFKYIIKSAVQGREILYSKCYRYYRLKMIDFSGYVTNFLLAKSGRWEELTSVANWMLRLPYTRSLLGSWGENTLRFDILTDYWAPDPLSEVKPNTWPACQLFIVLPGDHFPIYISVFLLDQIK